MNKKSFKDIEQAIKTAAEAHEPAFDEQSWKKMEVLLDKEKDRKRPFVFWIWWLLPVMIGAGVTGYFVFSNNGKASDQKAELTIQQTNKPTGENANNNSIELPAEQTGTGIKDYDNNLTVAGEKREKEQVNNVSRQSPVSGITVKGKQTSSATESEPEADEVYRNRKRGDKVKGRMTGNINAPATSTDDENKEMVSTGNNPESIKGDSKDKIKEEEIVVIEVDSDKTSEKEIEKMVDSVVEKLNSDKRNKNKMARFYIIAAAGAEANGVKLFSGDKITGRLGLSAGYRINKNLSVQAGFFVSSKKYGAAGADYKTKPGTYWSAVDIKSIEGNCKVYEIPVSLVYNFTPGKKLNVFASAGLSSYIMKKEDYRFYYEHYGAPQQAEVYYKGNRNLFSVLRISAGVEKKISGSFSVFLSPGIAIPLSGVGEGEVKLYSTDLMIGLKFSPGGKKKQN